MIDKVKQGMSNKRRGADAERRLAGLIRDNWGYPVRRGYYSAGEPDLVGLTGVHIETKYVERLNLRAAMEQSRRDSLKYEDGEPVVIHGRARGDWLVTMDLSFFFELYGAWTGGCDET